MLSGRVLWLLWPCFSSFPHTVAARKCDKHIQCPRTGHTNCQLGDDVTDALFRMFTRRAPEFQILKLLLMKGSISLVLQMEQLRPE